MTERPVRFIGDVVFTDHYMRRLAERYGVKPKSKQRKAAARALLLGLTGMESERSHLLHIFPDGRFCWLLDVAGRRVKSVVAVSAGKATLITALPK